MSTSETITRTDLTNILNDILPVYNSTGFTVEKITASSATSVSANGGTAWIQVRIPSGYDPVCIVGYYLNGGSGCSVYNEAIAKDSNGYYCSFALRNGQSSVNTVTIDAYVLCKQSLTHFTQAMADYIVEQGTSGIWTYRKWNSGRYECEAFYNFASYAVSTARGSLYSGAWVNIAFPSSVFTAAPNVTATLALDTTANAMFLQIQNVLSTGVNMRLISSGSMAANSAGYAHIQAVGKWK